VVACGEGSLLLTKVQPEGGRAMSSREYAQGRRVRKGDRLSS
jgi:methionyl-tRNA formyltransferase